MSRLWLKLTGKKKKIQKMGRFTFAQNQASSLLIVGEKHPKVSNHSAVLRNAIKKMVIIEGKMVVLSKCVKILFDYRKKFPDKKERKQK